jgi:hypothetical protein
MMTGKARQRRFSSFAAQNGSRELGLHDGARPGSPLNRIRAMLLKL